MRLFLLLTLLLTLADLGSAQPVITSEDLPVVEGSSYILHTVIPAPDLSSKGEWLWDLTTLRIGKSQAVSILSTEDSPLAGLFTESETCYSLGGGNYLYSKKTPEALFKYGGVAKATELVMTDPQEYFQFPLAVGRSWTDEFSSRFSSKGMQFERKGHLKGEVRAECTLLMPYGSVHEVLHVSLVEELSDAYEVMGTPMAQKTTNLIECFVKAGNPEPLITWTRVMVDGQEASSFITFTDGDHVKGKDSDGPWNSFDLERSSEEDSMTLMFISEWKGVMTLELIDGQGRTFETLEVKSKPGPMEVKLNAGLDLEYIRILSEGRSILISVPRF